MREKPHGEDGVFQTVGDGAIGGKAQGLVQIHGVIEGLSASSDYPGLSVSVPPFLVIATDWFDRFMDENHLRDLAFSNAGDSHKANAFQRAKLPADLLGLLAGHLSNLGCPLAIRSSSLLEDAMHEPFAGVYATKMLPNNAFSREARLRTLIEGIKFVYASTFFRNAMVYRGALGRSHDEEKMAVIIQEIVGRRHGDRFYPTVSGVARSYNFYHQGHAKPEEGVVSLALGLGKTIVDGGRSWTYSPAYPKSDPPFGSMKQLLAQTQTEFWSVNMGKPPRYDPIGETEYLYRGGLKDAENDGVLRRIASTYDPHADRIIPGTGSPGPRVLNFLPLLRHDEAPLNALVKDLLDACRKAFDGPVEIEFAVNLEDERGRASRFGFLQVRPMVVSDEHVEVKEEELRGDGVIVASEQVLGNGRIETIEDVVFVKPDTFSARETGLIAAELDTINERLVEAGRSYLLLAVGRLGSSDSWLGIPVQWGQVAGAKAIVEAYLDEMNVDMSQGSHFFHNITSFQVLYFSTDKTGKYPLNWPWFQAQEPMWDGQFVRHIRTAGPLRIAVDGKSGRGVVSHERSDPIGD